MAYMNQAEKIEQLRKARAIFEQVLKEDGIAYEAKAKSTITSSLDVMALLYSDLSYQENEKFCCLFLDNQHKLIQNEVISQGTVNQCNVYPREIIKKALAYNAAALIVAHNHPSGLITPSQSDRNITKRISDACNLMEIKLLDHIIIGEGAYYSFAEEEEMP